MASDEDRGTLSPSSRKRQSRKRSRKDAESETQAATQNSNANGDGVDRLSLKKHSHSSRSELVGVSPPLQAVHDSEKVHCVCRQAYMKGETMLACDECGQWYHPSCVGISERGLTEIKWVCPNCRLRNAGPFRLTDFRLGGLDSLLGEAPLSELDTAALCSGLKGVSEDESMNSALNSPDLANRKTNNNNSSKDSRNNGGHSDSPRSPATISSVLSYPDGLRETKESTIANNRPISDRELLSKLKKKQRRLEEAQSSAIHDCLMHVFECKVCRSMRIGFALSDEKNEHGSSDVIGGLPMSNEMMMMDDTSQRRRVSPQLLISHQACASKVSKTMEILLDASSGGINGFDGLYSGVNAELYSESTQPRRNGTGIHAGGSIHHSSNSDGTNSVMSSPISKESSKKKFATLQNRLHEDRIMDGSTLPNFGSRSLTGTVKSLLLPALPTVSVVLTSLTNELDTLMCWHCYGQIPSHHYASHLTRCMNGSEGAKIKDFSYPVKVDDEQSDLVPLPKKKVIPQPYFEERRKRRNGVMNHNVDRSSNSSTMMENRLDQMNKPYSVLNPPFYQRLYSQRLINDDITVKWHEFFDCDLDGTGLGSPAKSVSPFEPTMNPSLSCSVSFEDSAPMDESSAEMSGDDHYSHQSRPMMKKQQQSSLLLNDRTVFRLVRDVHGSVHLTHDSVIDSLIATLIKCRTLTLMKEDQRKKKKSELSGPLFPLIRHLLESTKELSVIQAKVKKVQKRAYQRSKYQRRLQRILKRNVAQMKVLDDGQKKKSKHEMDPLSFSSIKFVQLDSDRSKRVRKK